LVTAELRSDAPIVIEVSGLSNAGKTTLCRELVEMMPTKVVQLRCDDFSAWSYADRNSRIRAARVSGDPEALAFEENPMNWCGWEDLAWALDRLRLEGTVRFDRAWNKANGELNALLEVRLPERHGVAILCDGIFLLHEPVRQRLDNPADYAANERPTIDGARGHGLASS
jgi:hypothetical protein